MEDTISAAKAEFTRATDRLARTFASTPDDKINWSPSATCRTPLEQVVHAAMGTEGISGMFAGKPFPYANMRELDTELRKLEKGFTTREQAQALLEKTSAAYLAWLDGLTPEQLGSNVNLPPGPFPLAMAITFPADHMRGHAAQLEYIQTIYGDHDMHQG